MSLLTPRRLLVLGGTASLAAEVATPFLSDIDGVIPWTVLALGIIGSASLVLLAGMGIASADALAIRGQFHGGDLHEHRRWIGWFEAERSSHGKRLDEHAERLARLEEKIDELLANSRGAQ